MYNKSAHYFFMGLLLAVAVLAVFIFLPFLSPLVFALSLAVIFSPVYRYILRTLFKGKEKSTIAAFITLFLVIVIVLVPGFFIVSKLYAEVQDMYYFLTEESGRSTVIAFLNNTAEWFSGKFFNLFPAVSFDSLNVTEYLQQGVEFVFSHVDRIFTGLGKVFMGIFITFFALFYFIRDGKEFKREIILLSPLIDSDDEHIFKKLEHAVYSVFAGSLIIGVVQGILTGIGFAIFHVPDPTVWGLIAAVAALIPGIGTSLILIPGILYLFFMSTTFNAVGLLIWGLLAVGLIDNLLGPVLVNKGIKIHPFLVLLSVLGGLGLFGIVGFILGPLVLALLFALLEIYRTSKKTI